VWLAGELGRNLMTHSWHCFVLVGGVILNVIDGGHGPRSTDPGRKIALRAVLEGFPEAVFLFDVHSCIIELNKAAERLSGQSRDELLGMRAGALFSRVLGAEADVNPEAIVSRTLRGELVRHERRVLHNAIGGLIDVRISGSPMYYPAKRILGALVVIADITELSALQQQIASSKRHFEVGQMTAGLAHDFNNVLGTISQAVYVLETAADRSEPDRTMLSLIDNAVRRGAEIVNNIREYLRGSSQVRIRVAVRRLLEEVLHLAKPMLEMHPDITVTRQIENAAEVYASPPELRRVFTNLVLNALDAMPQGGTLSLICSRSKGQMIVSVRDTGAGIPLEAQNMIFSPYFTTKAKGTGLGLSGARKAIQAHGGDIRFESVPGQGTTFFVSLPIANGDELPAPRAA
jgi:two-component system, cell cycle sensor histidine kinase and response regulator CckA